ncbi:hypothetical protein K388_06501 [Streptomyces sp. KhCrAH-43]|uniref:hypothetical protein n=1 Tax=Streptomyces sp. KhCrAH-43 TaxID=1305827 RepID=UPI000381AC27|nr:hypothetical protein [Streptomyces sp. SID4920]MYX68548.1 hypothetical protein [Streptomyces sp. SID8373]RAJ50790.1 hypothetical protein K388_06501 [Streptomyces sp. KhCrAH-43]
MLDEFAAGIATDGTVVEKGFLSSVKVLGEASTPADCDSVYFADVGGSMPDLVQYHRLHGDLKVPFAYRIPPPTPTRAGLDPDPRYRASGGAQYVGTVHVVFGGRHHTAGASLELAVAVLEDGTSRTTGCACSGAATARTRARYSTPGVIQAQASGPVRTADQTARYG